MLRWDVICFHTSKVRLKRSNFSSGQRTARSFHTSKVRLKLKRAARKKKKSFHTSKVRLKLCQHYMSGGGGMSFPYL